MSVKSLVIIVEMMSDTPDGNSLGLRTTYSNVALKRVNGELFPSRQLKKKAYIPYPKGIGVLRHSYKMLSHKLQTKICKSGYLELMNLPFTVGTQIEVTISRKKKKKNLKRLIGNDHIWAEEDIKAVEAGREIINQWKIS